MTKDELIQLLAEMSSQPKDQQFGLRISKAERQALAKLASAYHRPMAQVISDLIRQGIVDYVMDGECLALVEE